MKIRIVSDQDGALPATVEFPDGCYIQSGALDSTLVAWKNESKDAMLAIFNHVLYWYVEEDVKGTKA